MTADCGGVWGHNLSFEREVWRKTLATSYPECWDALTSSPRLGWVLQGLFKEHTRTHALCPYFHDKYNGKR